MSVRVRMREERSDGGPWAELYNMLVYTVPFGTMGNGLWELGNNGRGGLEGFGVIEIVGQWGCLKC